ncbi:MAG TPA: DUF488 domain-containing protein, partial [Stellaceae bacterium]|nr:DUF488 domain-containing protein [Stellaceae bacterium]
VDRRGLSGARETPGDERGIGELDRSLDHRLRESKPDGCDRNARRRRLIDVRDRPLSRRAGFSKRQLQAALEERGIRYVHLKALGTPPEGREANRRREWKRFWAIVHEKLASPEAEFELRQAAALAAEAPSCLLCYEADWQTCHRRRVAEILVEREGVEIRHLGVGMLGDEKPKAAAKARRRNAKAKIGRG